MGKTRRERRGEWEKEGKGKQNDGKRGRWRKTVLRRGNVGIIMRGKQEEKGWGEGGGGKREGEREERKEAKLHQSAAGHRNASDRSSHFQSRQILPPIFGIFGVNFLYIYK